VRLLFQLVWRAPSAQGPRLVREHEAGAPEVDAELAFAGPQAQDAGTRGAGMGTYRILLGPENENAAR
jgi:hypothetical protein